jgi:galactose mutarotase-like enzyme
MQESQLTRRTALLLAAGPSAAAEQSIRLRSEHLEAAIMPAEGGEMGSLRYKFRGEWVELLYKAMEYGPSPGWRGKAPWLWPAVGRNFAPGHAPDGGNEVTGSYVWDGVRRAMPIHGFVRQMRWQVVEAGKQSAELALASGGSTRNWYPWDWELRVRYAVSRGGMAIRFGVAAGRNNASPMPFSAGNHISFRDPLLPSGTRGSVRFATNSSLQFAKTREGLPTGEWRDRRFPALAAIAGIAPEYPLSLGGYPRRARMRMEDPSGLRIEFEQEASSIPAEPLIRFNVWGNEECFSPEPWV